MTLIIFVSFVTTCMYPMQNILVVLIYIYNNRSFFVHDFKWTQIVCVMFNIDHFTEQSGIRVSTDTCWQKKGSGKAYNSLSG